MGIWVIGMRGEGWGLGLSWIGVGGMGFAILFGREGVAGGLVKRVAG